MPTSPSDAPTTPLGLTGTFFSAGFRPFFLGAGIWAVVAMGLWLVDLNVAPVFADPMAWHAHALLFGCLSAAMAGFLLTAAPSWTKQAPLRGAFLAVLFVLWLAARIAMLWHGVAPALPVALLDLSMPLLLTVAVGRAVLAGHSWRNLSVVGLLILHTCGNALFHIGAAIGAAPAHGVGVRLGLAAGLLLVSVVGGRVTQNFTRNWLKRHGATTLPPQANWTDLACHVILGGALTLWTAAPYAPATGVALLAAAVVHFWRLSRWHPHKTLRDPLMWVLHAGYAFLPLGTLVVAAASLGLLPSGAALHLWAVGAITLTTLAVMTRATLAHTGLPLQALPGSAALYGCLIAAALLRPLAGALPLLALPLQTAAGLAWVLAFGGFVWLYGPRMLKAAD